MKEVIMLAYCDFIADRVKKCLDTAKNDVLQPVKLQSVGKVEWDLDAAGSFQSTKKTMYVWDAYGKEYRITVEEV
jgi:hypothetical protein